MTVVIALFPATPSFGQPRDRAAGKVSTLVDRQAADLDDALKVRPTLLVWIFDHSSNSQSLRSEIAGRFGAIYKIRDSAPREGQRPGQPLWSAVVSYDKEAAFVIREPTESYDDTWKAVDNIRDSTEPATMTFAAIKQAADEYLSFRTKRSWHVIFVVVTDKAGDDPPENDELVSRFRANASPVYVFGATTPFSTQAARIETRREEGKPASAKEAEHLLSDCRHWDRIDLAYASGANDRNQNNSGFGPFALARLCHESGGEFAGLRPMLGEPGASFPPGYLRKYAPDYMADRQYEELLEDNKCRRALLEAAARPHTAVLINPPREFAKKDEAQLNNLLGQAQRAAAKVEPPINRLYEVLAAAEPDRERLTGARWQAGYDLALGRALAAKARCDGYNAMLAMIKQGKSFAKSGSTTWVLKESNVTTISSGLENMAKKSRMYLERVIQEHPNTPWAESASRELKAPLGWVWDEK